MPIEDINNNDYKFIKPKTRIPTIEELLKMFGFDVYEKQGEFVCKTDR